MKKIFTLLLVLTFTMGAFAQKGKTTKSKVGYINTNELWALMPEKKAADEKLKAMESEMIAFVQKEQKSFQEGVVAFQKDSANMSELVKNQTLQKLIQQQESLQTLPEDANKELTNKQEELYKPIREKMQKAVDEVAKENGYDYVLDAAFGNIIFTKNEEDNILPLVKVKLGLK